MSIVTICLVCASSIVVTCPSTPAACFAFCLCFIRFVFVDRSCFSGEQKKKQGRIWSSANYGRPKAALLFWFFGDFRCGVLLFMGILVIYKYENR